MSRILSGGVSLETLKRKRASTHFEGRISWLFLICSRKREVTLQLRWVPQGLVRVSVGKSGLHASCEGPLGIAFQLVLRPRYSSGVAAGTLGFLSSADMDLRVPMKFPQGSQASSRLETC